MHDYVSITIVLHVHAWCSLLYSGSLSVDWINDKIYWTDVHAKHIGVLDLMNSHLLITDMVFSPRGLVVDPASR